MNGSLRILLVGPLPPPAGGMANQTGQLQRLLSAEGLAVAVVRTNSPYRPAFVRHLRGIRALVRLLPFLRDLWRTAAKVDVVHVMANSGWAWRLAAVPAIRLAKSRGRPVVVNYRGGLAGEFLARAADEVRRDLAHADVLVVPSPFLKEIFARHGITATIIPNIVDLERFQPAQSAPAERAPPHLVVARNLEHIYGNDIALRALRLIRRRRPGATLTITGSGPQRAALEALVDRLDLREAVTFSGSLGPEQMSTLYRQSDVLLNPARADNTPNSVLEALASGVPVVSAAVGGVPFLVEHDVTAVLVNPDSPEALAEGVLRVLDDSGLRERLVRNGADLAGRCSWQVVREQWLSLYRSVASGRAGEAAPRPVVY